MRVLVTGASGQLGTDIVAELERRAADRRRGPKWQIVAAGRRELDVSGRERVLAVIADLEPDVIIHAAALTDVDACEEDPERALAVNALGTRHVAEAARLVSAHVCYLSTDYVFDGRSKRPYTEWDRPNPLSVYGLAKLGGEQEVDRSATIVRTAWVCGRYGHNIVKTILSLSASGAPLRFVDDRRGSPTSSSDLAAKVVDLASSRRPGIFHVTNQGETTWYGLARAVLSHAGLDPGRVEAIAAADLDPPRPAPRPANSVLDNAVLRMEGDELLPPWEVSIGHLVEALTGA
jgi:dTDP-4-dehydrorhamnose reductase